jgi:hypothetical protein
MTFESLVYSNQRPLRISRHLLFWLTWFLFLFSTWGGLILHVEISKAIDHDLLSALIRMLPQIPFCYFIIYFLFPRFFLQRRFITGGILLIASFAVFYYLQTPLKNVFTWEPGFSHPSIGFAWLMLTHRTGPLTCCAVMASIKFLKIWYVKQEENISLKRENALAELQLLKAQVHPHFLFNTLNNIYSFTLAKSPIAADLLEKLSGILRYMLDEGNKESVLIKKEVDLVLDYISLERVRYGNRLDISVDIDENYNNKAIAPLLMIPFIENSFKHGSSKMLKDPKVKLSITVKGNDLIFFICNNKPTHGVLANGKSGVGLMNVKKRLDLLYPDRHELKIQSTEDTFSVSMTINLENSSRVETRENKIVINRMRKV